MNDFIANAESLGAAHHFVWDRTRAIRNDFSIQQMTKVPDLEIAIDCYERIARFHILSLHQLAQPEKPYDKYDNYQEREQLDRTLLSLMQYYDDVKGRLVCPNEAEFRAYSIIFQAQNPNPDVEDRVNAWGPKMRSNPRVRKALELYSAAGNIIDPQGPLKAGAVHPVAREDWAAFLALVHSNGVSYLMACVAEMYFNFMRKCALNAIWRGFLPSATKQVDDFTLELLTDLLGFDDDEQTEAFCQRFGCEFKESPTGPYLDLHSIKGRTFPTATGGITDQAFSERLVEIKRMGRTFPAVINGLSVGESQRQGLVEEMDENSMEEDEDSLFVPDHPVNGSRFAQPTSLGDNKALTTSPFASTSDASRPVVTASQPWSFSAAPANPSGSFASTAQPVASQGAATATANPFMFGQPSTAASESFTNAKPAANPFASFGQPSAAMKPSPFGPQPTSISQTSDGGSQPTRLFDFAKPSSPPMSTANEGPSASTQASSFSFTPSDGATPSSQGAPSLFAPIATSAFTSPTPATSGISWGASSTSPFAPSKPASPPATASPSFAPPKTTSPPASTATFFNSTPAPPTNSSTLLAPAKQPPPELNKPAAGGDTIIEPAPSTGLGSSLLNQGDQSGSSPFKFGSTANNDSPRGAPQLPSFNSASFPQPSAETGNLPSVSTSSAPPVAEPKPAPLSAPASKPSFTFATQPNQPRKPSPLSQSFSAIDESAKPNQLSSSAQLNEPASPFKSNLRPQTQLAPLAKPAPVPVRSKEEIFQGLAREVMSDVDVGFIRQYVEFYARQTILNVYDELYMESLQQLADNFRKETLSQRYGKRWRDICWKRRLVRQGIEKRRRAKSIQSAREQKKKLAAETSAVDSFLKSVREPKSSSSRFTKSQQSASQESPNTDRLKTSKVSKAGDHVDQSGRVSKPQVPASRDTPLGPDLFKSQGSQSAHNFPNTPARNNYFRLRALGINPNGTSSVKTAARKRTREDSEEGTFDASPVPRKSRTPPQPILGSSIRPTTTASLAQSENGSVGNRRSISTNSPLSKNEQDDEELFARARAARAALSESATWYRSEVQKDEAQQREEMGRSLNTPSMQRAREAARLRASQSTMTFSSSVASSSATPRVPAYRMRESMFVPREQYGKAVEKAKEMAEARSHTPQQQAAQHHASMAPMSHVPSFNLQNATHSSYPPTSSQMPNVIPDSFGSQPPPQFANVGQHSSMPGNYTAGNSTQIAEAIYKSMMPSGPPDTQYSQTNGFVAPDSIMNPAALNGTGAEHSFIDPSLQNWNGNNANGGQGEVESVVDTEVDEEDEEEGYGYDEEEGGGYAQQQRLQEFFDEEEYDEEEEEGEEEWDEDDMDDETDEEADPILQRVNQYRNAPKKEVLGPSIIKSGTGTQDDAFELSD